ncbi:S8 family peptidase [Paenibacillus koleovorans]|uniref:S8 family peptidase n=1 Tax=Paenibacillus koleovorans TaxID=121608 RepID=UPI000FDA3DFE|nr:S8 family serine peptidase [Paenibacillus koleovorans]
MNRTFRLALVQTLIIAILCSLFAAPIMATGEELEVGAQTIAQELTLSGDIVPGQLLVKYKSTPRALRASGFSSESLSPLVQKLSFSESTDLSEKMRQLQQDPNVELVEPVYRVRIPEMQQAGTVAQAVYYSPERKVWGQTVTQLTYGSSIASPSSMSQVIVAVLDSGIDLLHPDLSGMLLQGYDFINNDSFADDDNGHGTHVAGIIGASAAGPNGYTGAAPGVRLLPVKVLNSAGVGTTAEIIKGIEYAVNRGAKVINMSLSSSEYSKLVHDAVKEATSNGVIVVAAAGNGSSHWINSEPGQVDLPAQDRMRYFNETSYPAAFSEVISVGALMQLPNQSLTIADFSNVKKVDVAAPGVDIYSTSKDGHGYQAMSGTSQATPFVTAMAALLWANDPGLTAPEVRSLIQNSAKELTPPSLSYANGSLTAYDYFGAGLVDGKTAFTKQRAELSVDWSRALSEHTVSVAVYERDAHGQVVPLNHALSLTVKRILEDEERLVADDLGLGGTVIQSVYGYGSAILPITGTLKSAFGYLLYVDDPDGSEDVTIRSMSKLWLQRPAPPTPDKAPGQYVSQVTIGLGGQQPGDELYYRKGSDSSFTRFGTPILLSGTSNIVAFAIRNHIFSEDATYSYTIVPPAPSFPTGPFFLPTPTPTPKPQPSGTYKPDEEKLMKQLDTPGVTNVVVEAELDPDAKEWTIGLSIDLLTKATESNKSITLRANGLQMVVPPNALNIQGKGEVSFKTSRHEDLASSNTSDAPSRRLTSPVYDFTYMLGTTPGGVFKEPIQVTLPFEIGKVNPNSSRLAVYTYDEETKTWVYVGGKVNSDQTITVELPHFSKYAVMESTQTFSDIESHWARKEIELMTDRQIVQGMTDHLFEPGAMVTRAQFVTLLSRALDLKQNGVQWTPFEDVPLSEWYAKSVIAAYNAKLVSGIDEKSFRPDDPITRQQMAVLIVNAYLYKTGQKLSDLVGTQEVKFVDEGSIADWARAYVRTASGLGLLAGDEEKRFAPLDNASRAEAAVVIYRLLTQSQ